ncbi:glycoside hydrolase superfamily [Neurospora tetraspora]|uniref:Glycoside hydrolase superfamily n=1 Tax=Neurospora tetraspora TaxID=94610 RepID=A0AAE0MQF5_9PEZI|nr:glycoside hydrolase superfamily [Neurospora tetraspora]
MLPPKSGALLALAAAIAHATAAPSSSNHDSPLASRQATSTITVDLTKIYQTMDGFGFSLAFQRANLITNIGSFWDLLFNRTTGAGFSIIRNGIGSSPDSRDDHMNTIAPNHPGGPKVEPQYVWDGKDSGQLWVTQRGVADYGLQNVYADAWSAPGYMKTNNNENNGGTLCGVPGATCSSGDWRQAYADYLIAYIRFYLRSGVAISHLGFLNEPEFSASYASMRSTGAQAADFIKNFLYPTLVAQNLAEQVGIVCCDSEGWGNQVQMTNAIKSAGAEGMLKAVSSHTYTGGPSGPMSTRARVWLSEQCDLNGGWDTKWYGNGGAGEGLTWANNVYSAVVNNNISGYVYWEGVQWPSPNTNEKLIRVDNSTNTYVISKRLWALANWSRYVRPGAVRVSTAGRPADGSIAVIAISSSGSAINVNVKITGASELGTATVEAYVSDNNRNCEKVAGAASISADGTITGTVASRSVTTFFVPGQWTS